MSGVKGMKRNRETYSFAVLAAWCRERQPWEWSDKSDAALITLMSGIDAGQWAQRGTVPELAADRVACKLGVVPYMIWPEWLEVGIAMADAADERKRLQNLRAVQRYQQRNRESVRKYGRQRARRLRLENAEAQNALVRKVRARRQTTGDAA